MKKLTIFQEKCENQLVDLIAKAGHQLVGKRIGEIPDTFFDRDTDTFVKFKVADTDIQIWIYDDGAMFTGPGIDERFEAEDYSSSDQLVQEFLADLRKILLDVNEQ